ncbi:hypothetical protein MGN01_17490 [Methylobacterium gnaphalii]|uniref:Uncharacterized protein n=1 Tax=Methylobacterium gnaphalii TaxID=1010610 RepID=A0A512JIY9_9HYPH|nr:hypothetical protein MGN01_17490 [Methylobacterium gnaphalii]GLS49933.1 hypothetical protein GCM10007885_27850 [Methylobacterium gnaphalii]
MGSNRDIDPAAEPHCSDRSRNLDEKPPNRRDAAKDLECFNARERIDRRREAWPSSRSSRFTAILAHALNLNGSFTDLFNTAGITSLTGTEPTCLESHTATSALSWNGLAAGFAGCAAWNWG